MKPPPPAPEDRRATGARFESLRVECLDSLADDAAGHALLRFPARAQYVVNIGKSPRRSASFMRRASCLIWCMASIACVFPVSTLRACSAMIEADMREAPGIKEQERSLQLRDDALLDAQGIHNNVPVLAEFHEVEPAKCGRVLTPACPPCSPAVSRSITYEVWARS